MVGYSLLRVSMNTKTKCTGPAITVSVRGYVQHSFQFPKECVQRYNFLENLET